VDDARLEKVRRILRGGVDLHVHTAPSPMPRQIDAVDAARQADELEMRAVVVKSHHHATVMEVQALQKRGLQNAHAQVFGGIALNSAVGGLNPHAVDLALKMGGASSGSQRLLRRSISSTIVLTPTSSSPSST
jgi:Family of unknown function (DUF6282)